MAAKGPASSRVARPRPTARAAKASTTPQKRKTTTPDASGSLAVGSRLRARRELLGVSLRQFARDLNVSASFISQLETGKTQPSVATLYAICSALDMSVDDVFEVATNEAAATSASSSGAPSTPTAASSPVVAPSQRRRIVLDSGVTWERLSSAAHDGFDFVFVRYDVGGSSNSDGRLIRHVGTECGYVLRGELEITLGFETFRMRAGDAISFDSSTPHRLANVGNEPVEAVWFDEGGHNATP